MHTLALDNKSVSTKNSYTVYNDKCEVMFIDATNDEILIQVLDKEYGDHTPQLRFSIDRETLVSALTRLSL